MMPDEDAPTRPPPPARRVLMVCAGNICRSPAAEAMLLAHAAGPHGPRVEVRSRGIHDWNVGKPAHATLTRIAAQRGYDLASHVAAQLTAEDLAWADDVLVMDDTNRTQILKRFPTQLSGRLRLLDPDGIPDPWLADTDAAYSAALDQIERAVDAYVATLGRPSSA